MHLELARRVSATVRSQPLRVSTLTMQTGAARRSISAPGSVGDARRVGGLRRARAFVEDLHCSEPLLAGRYLRLRTAPRAAASFSSSWRHTAVWLAAKPSPCSRLMDSDGHRLAHVIHDCSHRAAARPRNAFSAVSLRVEGRDKHRARDTLRHATHRVHVSRHARR